MMGRRVGILHPGVGRRRMGVGREVLHLVVGITELVASFSFCFCFCVCCIHDEEEVGTKMSCESVWLYVIHVPLDSRNACPTLMGIIRFHLRLHMNFQSYIVEVKFGSILSPL
jgi:hypothetical protein